MVEFKSDAAITTNSTDSTSESASGPTLACWTSNGVNVYIDMSYYYKFDKTQLVTLYKTFGDQWKNQLVRVSFGLLKEATVGFTTEQFYTSRITIGTTMKNHLNTNLPKYFGTAITVTDIMLRKISFDASLEAAINKKLIQAHLKKSYENQKLIQGTKKDTEFLVSGYQNTIDNTHMEAYGAGNKTLMDTEAAALKDLITTFNEWYGYVMGNFTLVNFFLWKLIFWIEQSSSDAVCLWD